MTRGTFLPHSNHLRYAPCPSAPGASGPFEHVHLQAPTFEQTLVAQWFMTVPLPELGEAFLHQDFVMEEQTLAHIIPTSNNQTGGALHMRAAMASEHLN